LAPAATGASYETHRARRREHGTVALAALQDGVLDIEHSLRWHDPGRFNGYVLSQHFAGTPVDPVNLRDALRAVNLKGRFAMRGVIHHLDLTVRDPDKVFAFYDAILSALGYRLERKSDRGFDWNLQSPLGVHSIGVVKASSEGAQRAHDRYSPGLHHVAWGVEAERR
jgi:hypothetical protein